MTAHSSRLVNGDFLDWMRERGTMAAASAERVRAAATIAGGNIERSVLELGLVDEDTLYQELAAFLGLEFVDEGGLAPEKSEQLGLTKEFLERVELVPVATDADDVIFACADPSATDVHSSIEFFLGVPIRMKIATPSSIGAALRSLEQASDGDASGAWNTDVERLKAMANDGPIIKLVNETVARAAGLKASDIHFEANESGAKVRFRIDGALTAQGAISSEKLAAVVSRLKVVAGLNISEKRRPQDGRMTVPVRGRNVDVRLSTLPTQFGESVVLRLLDQSTVSLDWASLGFTVKQAQSVRSILEQPNGIFLVAGPTGSGKTTSLYTALKEMNSEDRKIVTVEDPIEYSIDGVNQTQVENSVEMTFARALRAILRQDPDVVMVGEIRDEETADIAVRAALVGRLVLSTIHTNDSVSSITRLRDLGVPDYLIAATLRGVLSQRLARRTCAECSGAGCGECGDTGQKGRRVVSELLPVTTGLSQAISGGLPQDSIADLAAGEGFVTMQDAAKKMSRAGEISEQEAHRILGSL